MLLTSSGDNQSSLSIDPLNQIPPAVATTVQTMAGGRQSVSASAALKAMGGDRATQPPDSTVSISGATPAPSAADRLAPAHPSAQPSAGRKAVAIAGSIRETELDGLQALRQVAQLNARRKSRAVTESLGLSATALDRHPSDYAELVATSYAAPLSPLRERDIQALSDFFAHDDMPAIEVDVNQRLLWLLPEPYWEDDRFSLLQEFL